MKKQIAALLVCSACLGSYAGASYLEKEQRWAEQIVDFLMDGDAIYLSDGTSEFLAIETPAADDSTNRAAIVMHGTGVHPNWPDVVQPLRVGLTEAGWHTLSIQMPVLANEADYRDYPAIYDGVPGRIDAAIAHLREQGAETVVLLAHSQGATMTTYYLANSDAQIDGFAAIGMGPGIAGTKADNLAHLPKVSVPMLDLYGSEDLEEVIESSQARAAAATGSPKFEQKVVAGADHFFQGEEDDLLKYVQAWLEKI
jgi:pimeloyl-ACP methyl ester carboxylesterase